MFCAWHNLEWGEACARVSFYQKNGIGPSLHDPRFWVQEFKRSERTKLDWLDSQESLDQVQIYPILSIEFPIFHDCQQKLIGKVVRSYCYWLLLWITLQTWTFGDKVIPIFNQKFKRRKVLISCIPLPRKSSKQKEFIHYNYLYFIYN